MSTDMKSPYRLSSEIRPLGYALELAPDLEKFIFSGEETVELQIGESTDQIILNSAELAIHSAQVSFGDNANIDATEILLDDALERATLRFDSAIPLGQASLRIRFSGTLSDRLRGFYRARYVDQEGRQQYMATTQFEATDARRCFPCWDEPAMKATFDVTLVVPNELVALSNMPVREEEGLSGGSKAVRFETTPIMSTYLLAFVVGDLASLEASTSGGTTVRVWAVRGHEHEGKAALGDALKIIEYFDDYFGIPYPLPKLDHVAVSSLAGGAMENWGLITYQETALLYDPVNSATTTRQRITEIVAHEIAHMWFGNLVTMEWWDDLWLNESFATWMGDRAISHLYPDWGMTTAFVAHETSSALALDGLRNSHPIEVRVQDPAHIRELFDAISYGKGASVLRMLEDFLSEDVFREGLRRYIAKHKYSNARTEDLWSALSAASGQPVAEIMDPWIKRTGYPLLRIATDGVSVGIEQDRFLVDQSRNDITPTVWPIPVKLLTENEQTTMHLVTEAQTFVALPNSATGKSALVKVNSGQAGFYHAAYSSPAWRTLASLVSEMKLPPTDRLGIHNDAYAALRAGLVSADEYFNVLTAYRGEVDAWVWSDLCIHLAALDRLFAGESYAQAFQSFAASLLRDRAQAVGWNVRPDDDHQTRILRSIVLQHAGRYGNPDVLNEALVQFDSLTADWTSVHPDLRGAALSLAAQEGDESTFDALLQLEARAKSQEEKIRVLLAMANFRHPDLLQALLEIAISNLVRSHDSVTVISAVALNPAGQTLAWDFIKANWGELDRRYNRSGTAMMRLVATSGGFKTVAQAVEVDEFFAAHPTPSAQRTIAQSIERIMLNAGWLERYSGKVAAALLAR